MYIIIKNKSTVDWYDRMAIRITEEAYQSLIKRLKNKQGDCAQSAKEPAILNNKPLEKNGNEQNKKLSQAIGNASGKSKYRNKVCFFDNKRFQSILERDRYIVLKDMQAKGEISDLKTQVRFDFPVNDIHICFYLADFTYFDSKGAYCVEDTKGKKTDIYKTKKMLMKAIHNIEIIEIYAKKRNVKSSTKR